MCYYSRSWWPKREEEWCGPCFQKGNNFKSQNRGPQVRVLPAPTELISRVKQLAQVLTVTEEGCCQEFSHIIVVSLWPSFSLPWNVFLHSSEPPLSVCQDLLLKATCFLYLSIFSFICECLLLTSLNRKSLLILPPRKLTPWVPSRGWQSGQVS